MAGNSNSGSHKDRLFRTAMMIELKVRDAGEDMKTLRRIAGGVIEDALQAGDPQRRRDAVNMIADRIDGKAIQQQELEVTDGQNVALMPKRVENMEAWLNQYAPTTPHPTKQ